MHVAIETQGGVQLIVSMSRRLQDWESYSLPTPDRKRYLWEGASNKNRHKNRP